MATFSLDDFSPYKNGSARVELGIEVGDHYLVRRLASGEWIAGEVLAERRLEKEEGGNYQYYIHYDQLNRRHDEWVDRERINLTSASKCGLHVDINDDTERKLTRNQKRKYEELTPTRGGGAAGGGGLEMHDPEWEALEKEREALTKVRYIDTLQLGRYEMRTWYFSPYPDEYKKCRKLFICEFCLKYMKLERTFRYHQGQCTHRHPPGSKIYMKGNLEVYEIDGKLDKVYCQCLCLLAKLFLDHKTLYFDVEGFLFYLVVEVDRGGSRPVGYFSKEKVSEDGNNLACLLVLPPHQRKGLGKFLIQLSYELTKLERVTGSPEKPLSDLGLVSYGSYWSWVILEYLGHTFNLEEDKVGVTIDLLCQDTGISRVDVIFTLKQLGLLSHQLGPNLLNVDVRQVRELSHKVKAPSLQVDINYLTWKAPRKRPGVNRTPKK